MRDFSQTVDYEKDQLSYALANAIKERDEAIAECKSLWSLVNASKLRAYKAERERDEAREENEKLREALLRIRTWGIESKNFSSNDNGKMAHWIDEGCIGNLPKPDGPWIYEKMEATKMSERPTPETDAFAVTIKSVCGSKVWVPVDIARRIERERDEAYGLIKETEEYADRFCQERDEAREALAEWHDSALHVRQEYEDEQHCSCVPILRKLLKDAERERDEAIADRDIARLSALESDKAHDRMVAELEKVYKERDEAWACCDELVVDSNAITLAKTVMRLERERDEAREALEYIAHAGLSARHIEDYAKEFLRREEDEK